MPISEIKKNHLSEDVAVIKMEIVYIRKDLAKILSILNESDSSLLSRVNVSESEIKELKKNQWYAKTALSSSVVSLIGIVGTIVAAWIEFSSRK